MKLIIIISLLSLTACNRESSPDGRSQLRDEQILEQIDSLKEENRMIRDSIRRISNDVEELKGKAGLTVRRSNNG